MASSAWWIQEPVKVSESAVPAPPTSQICGLSSKLPPLPAAQREKDNPPPQERYKIPQGNIGLGKKGLFNYRSHVPTLEAKQYRKVDGTWFSHHENIPSVDGELTEDQSTKWQAPDWAVHRSHVDEEFISSKKSMPRKPFATHEFQDPIDTPGERRVVTSVHVPERYSVGKKGRGLEKTRRPKALNLMGIRKPKPSKRSKLEPLMSGKETTFNKILHNDYAVEWYEKRDKMDEKAKHILDQKAEKRKALMKRLAAAGKLAFEARNPKVVEKKSFCMKKFSHASPKDPYVIAAFGK